MNAPVASTGLPARIYIVGMMGAGKSTIGRKLASLLGYTFTDLDKEIEKHAGKTISQLFETEGEEGFRVREAGMLRTLKKEFTVIATGGGTPCYHHNMQYILGHGASIYLRAPVGLIVQRVSRSPSKRPSLKGLDAVQIRAFIEQKTAEREPYYSQANYVFDVPAASAESIVKSIV